MTTTSTTEVRWETDGFHKALDRYMRDSKKSVSQVMRQQAALIVKRIITIMPPSNGKIGGNASGDGITSKKRGELAVKGDISRIVSTLTASHLKNSEQVSAATVSVEPKPGDKEESSPGN